MLGYVALIFFLIAQQAPLQPQATPQVETQQDVCSKLTNPEHKSLAAQLTGKERILFCSVFDDVMRDKAVAYTKKSPKLSAQDAVTQVGKDSGLLFNPMPGGACPTG